MGVNNLNFRDSRLSLVQNSKTDLKQITHEEKQQDHSRIINEYLRSRKLRNHTEGTINGAKRILDNFFMSIGMYCWEVKPNDVVEYSDIIYDIGLTVTTRRGYLGEIQRFYQFLLEHPVIPIEALQAHLGYLPTRLDEKYGTRVQQPIDKWYFPTHVSDDTPQRNLPSKDQLREFFAFLRRHIETAQKPITLCRDYALFRLIYHTGFRANETCKLDVTDVRFDLGTIHCRFGKGTRGSGKRERYALLDYKGLDNVLKIYIKEHRHKFLGANKDPALFLSEAGRRIGESTIRGRLNEHISTARENGIDIPLFSCHDLRRAFATHLYEEHPEKIEVIRQMLGHLQLSTTQRYLRPNKQFIVSQFEEITASRISRLKEDECFD